MSYTKVATMNAFTNEKEPNSNRPDYSNGKCRIEETIPAGEYSLGIWKSEKGLSLKLEKRFDDVGFTPAPQSQDTGDVDDIIL